MKYNQIWPCIIVRTRYNGVYEGGVWAAFQCYDDDLYVTDWDGPDGPCASFWLTNTIPVGVGDTPNAAYEALRTVLINANRD